MKSDGYLVPPAPGEKEAPLWHETWKRVDRFLPDMRKEIFPDPPPLQQKQQQRLKQERVPTKQVEEGKQVAGTSTEES